MNHKEAQLTIEDVLKPTGALRVFCTACDTGFVWIALNADPDYCPYCGAEFEYDLFTNPERRNA